MNRLSDAVADVLTFLQRLTPEISVAFVLILLASAILAPAPALPPTPAPTATAPASSIVFDLPSSKIQSDLGRLTSNSIAVILVYDEPAVDGKTVTRKSDRFLATLLDVLDADGVPLASPYPKAATVRIALSRANNDAQILEFVRQLPAASVIYVLPES